MGLLGFREPPRRPGARAWWLLVGATIAGVAFFGGGLFLALDRVVPAGDRVRPVMAPADNRAVTSLAVSSSATASASPGTGLPGLDVMVARLEAKLAAGTGTADQWMLLGQTYRELSRAAEALGAFERAAAIDPKLPGLDAELREARRRAGGAPKP
mgnify:CR=1 FL=1